MVMYVPEWTQKPQFPSLAPHIFFIWLFLSSGHCHKPVRCCPECCEQVLQTKDPDTQLLGESHILLQGSLPEFLDRAFCPSGSHGYVLLGSRAGSKIDRCNSGIGYHTSTQAKFAGLLVVHDRERERKLKGVRQDKNSFEEPSRFRGSSPNLLEWG